MNVFTKSFFVILSLSTTCVVLSSANQSLEELSLTPNTAQVHVVTAAVCTVSQTPKADLTENRHGLKGNKQLIEEHNLKRQVANSRLQLEQAIGAQPTNKQVPGQESQENSMQYRLEVQRKMSMQYCFEAQRQISMQACFLEAQRQTLAIQLEQQKLEKQLRQQEREHRKKLATQAYYKNQNQHLMPQQDVHSQQGASYNQHKKPKPRKIEEKKVQYVGLQRYTTA